jgi:hypothetical protein
MIDKNVPFILYLPLCVFFDYARFRKVLLQKRQQIHPTARSPVNPREMIDAKHIDINFSS